VSADEGGVLGNLPRSRPGERSPKRAKARSEQPPRREQSASEPPAGGLSLGGAARTGVKIAVSVAGAVLDRIPGSGIVRSDRSERS
jgi:hypothetical protein